MTQAPLSFVLIFLLFSLLFLSNTYKLWFKTETYYQDVYNSLTRTPVPFKSFFLRRLENRRRWELEQKIFSIIGFVAVIGADVLLLLPYFSAQTISTGLPNFSAFAWIIIIIIFTVLIVSFIGWVKIFFTKEKQTKYAIEKVNKYFGFLYERGFEMLQADYFSNGNGAWAILLQSKECKIRINQDRGGIYCEIAPVWADEKKYQDIYRVVTQIEERPQNINRSQVKDDINSQLEFYSNLINSYYNEIIALMNRYPKPLYKTIE